MLNVRGEFPLRTSLRRPGRPRRLLGCARCCWLALLIVLMYAQQGSASADCIDDALHSARAAASKYADHVAVTFTRVRGDWCATEFDLSHVVGTGTIQLADLLPIHTLETLRLNTRSFHDPLRPRLVDANFLTSFARLRNLTIDPESIRESARQIFGQLHDIEAVDLSGGPIGSFQVLDSLRASSKLQALTLENVDLTDAVLLDVAALGQVRKLNLQENYSGGLKSQMQSRLTK